eukprot:CAMPEP_0178851894 /NCGR_PEP_ID=MMETSP0746-20121128/21374_1 /TAXON_ID=913974 /ORGANISM="Nitzschia punctata, Strain CCMP561" /LENGTH=150 /DNA_ID=CAMNT_0020517507 /DNA_START=182 /DNA_END=634 /DNA_ORIENTATION=-
MDVIPNDCHTVSIETYFCWKYIGSLGHNQSMSTRIGFPGAIMDLISSNEDIFRGGNSESCSRHMMDDIILNVNMVTISHVEASCVGVGDPWDSSNDWKGQISNFFIRQCGVYTILDVIILVTVYKLDGLRSLNGNPFNLTVNMKTNNSKV